MGHGGCFKKPSSFDNDTGFEEYLVCHGGTIIEGNVYFFLLLYIYIYIEMKTFCINWFQKLSPFVKD